eukprot:TRINITY_DN4659_c0_g1_i1.p1 TRINITY_DN4659_c0_g1~~TRINITY_DN4659_c0_g1_i1.p1  ORF type:complete len:212 (+),score=42.82 TRINITY_DN4659_c0_g1_i1:53-688(+)
MPRYYTPSEVQQHSQLNDCWVSWHGKVYDLTSLTRDRHSDPLIAPIAAAAGTDISHWFDAETGDIKTFIDPVAEIRVYYTPQGRFLHIPSTTPSTGAATENPWWMEPRFCIGNLSKKTRKIRIINTLTHQEHEIEVCVEQTLKDILERYLEFNAHAGSYTWKRLGRVLDMNKTLEENGIPDESDKYADLAVDDDYYTPALHLYFNDDHTSA